MQLHQQIDVALAPTRVWEALADVELVALCIPGAELAPTGETVADGDYKGSLTVRFGPKSIKFNGGVHYARDDAEQVAAITGSGQDLRSRTRVRTTLNVQVLPALAASESRLIVEGDMEIAGPLASLVEAGAEQVARQLIDQFAANLRASLEAEPAGDAESDAHGANGVEGGPAGGAGFGAKDALPSSVQPTQGINVMSLKTLVSIVWATIKSWLRIGRR